ncbi:MAG: hypothetical protein U0V56_01030 [Actinomycetota bacterium]
MGPDVRNELGRARLEDLLREARREAGAGRTSSTPRRPAPRHEAGPWS